MGRQVTVILVCDVCKKPVDEESAVAGELAATRRRFSLHMHPECLDSLVASSDVVPRKRHKRGRPKGSTNKRKATTSARAST